MAISTYAELKTAIADFLNRDDLTSVIPSFIALAEQQMARDIRHWRQEKRIETTLNERYENLPSDFIEALELSTDNNRRLTLISTAEMQDRKEATSTSTLSMQYYARIPALSDSNTSNWVLSYAADAYLYGALLHSAPYLQEDQRSVVWAGLYQSAIDGLRRDNDGGKYGGPLKMGVPR